MPFGWKVWAHLFLSLTPPENNVALEFPQQVYLTLTIEYELIRPTKQVKRHRELSPPFEDVPQSLPWHSRELHPFDLDAPPV